MPSLPSLLSSILPAAARARRHALLPALLGAVLLACAASAAASEGPADGGWAALHSGAVVLLRHAHAPGVGDPPGLRLDDCATQRNLDDAGRAQARRIGARLRERGVAVGAVLASQWCRTRETAELAFPGRVREDARFNSFFGNRNAEPAQTAAALAVLAAWRGPGVLVVVTHQVNISALTGAGAASGEGVVLRPRGDGVEVLAFFAP